MPFETKPRIARKSNPPSPKTDQAPLSSISKSNVFNHDTKTHSEFKPHGGVTFHKTSSLEVELVGHGYTEDSQNNDTRTTATTVTAAPAQHGPKNKDIKKPHNNTKSMFIHVTIIVCVCVCVCMCAICRQVIHISYYIKDTYSLLLLKNPIVL